MMSDDMLSQDEIDALLSGSTDDSEREDRSSQRNKVEEYISSLEEDALGEIGNISFGSSATALSSLLNQKVEITTPAISTIRRSELSDEFPKPHVAINVNYTDGFSGENMLVIKNPDAAIIADLMLGGNGTAPSEELNDIHLSAVQEAMNQMMGSAATSMSTVFKKKVDISPPAITVLDLEGNKGTEKIPNDEVLIKVSFALKVGTLIDSNIMQLLPVEFAKNLVDELLNPPEEEAVQAPVKEEKVEHKPSPAPQQQHSTEEKRPVESKDPQLLGGAGGQHLTNSTVQSAQFSNFEHVQLNDTEQRNLDMLMDIPLKVTVELGRTKRTIKEILELSSGSVVELDKLAGEPVDIHVNDKLMAKGEVVVIDENFGVRVTDILSPKDRLKKLK
ncbi:flagellar motor switch phosphatase FliY [Halobacillus andaensis]|uniref:Flagellar motor switch phosphatase FliY n=1 Tax=Halobacillus andaensis TaxID=1176239 RepID=A0A917ETD9_HALAA|nr:flagellar motor switch phosphatase FliY [Halobacillus andaensis]MBP2003485.1 flagellar motor switch protein FliN/FliY [Halobacillus andaensis]GGF10965.1 flagellar motor switch phosphatase FliY [Halobacillus andaensis]